MHNIGAKVMFIEVNNEDEQFLARNYHTTVQYSVDYAGLNDASSVSPLDCSTSIVLLISDGYLFFHSIGTRLSKESR